MQTCDVLVLGGGPAAIAAAYEIQPFAQVVLVTPPPAATSTLLLPATLERLDGRLATASRAFYDWQASRLAGGPVLAPIDRLITLIDGEPGSFAAPGEHPNARVSRAEILAQLPFLAPVAMGGGVLDTGTLELDAAALDAAQLRALVERGGQVVETAGSIEIAGEGAPWRVNAGTARLEANVLVNAAGVRTENIAALATVPALGLIAYRRITLAFTADTPPPDGMPAVQDTASEFLLRPDGVNFVATVTLADPLDPFESNPRSDDSERAISRIQALTRLRVERVVACRTDFVTIAPDQAPVVGHDDFVPGFFWIAGEGGEARALAPALARAAAGLLVDGVLPRDLIDLGIVPEDLLPLRFRTLRDV